MHIKEHFQTITYHRRLVRQGCFRVGLYWQGLTHDLSKYSLTEFLVGAKYFQGDCSPNNAEKEKKGYSSCKPLAVSSEKQARTGGDAPRKPCFAQSLTANAGR